MRGVRSDKKSSRRGGSMRHPLEKQPARQGCEARARARRRRVTPRGCFSVPTCFVGIALVGMALVVVPVRGLAAIGKPLSDGLEASGKPAPAGSWFPAHPGLPGFGSVLGSARKLLALSVPIERLDPPVLEVELPETDPELSAERQALRRRFQEARRQFIRRDFAAARATWRGLLQDYPAFGDYGDRELARMDLLEAGDGSLDATTVVRLEARARRLLRHPGTLQTGWAHYFEGRVRLAQGRMEEAETSLSRALALGVGPPRSVLYYYLGQALEARQPEEAYACYRRAETLSDGSLEARASAASERLARGLAPGERCIDWAIRHDALARRLGARRNVPLFEAIEEAIEACPCARNRLDFERLRGLYFLRTNRLERAEPLLRAVLEAEIAMGDPRWVTIEAWQRALSDKGEVEARLRLLERYVAAGPGEDGVDAYFLLAYLRRSEGRRLEAERLYEEVARRFPGHSRASEARWLSVWGHVRRQDWPRALVALRRLVRDVIPGSLDDAQARYWLARSLAASGQAARASAVLDDVDYRFPFSYYGTLATWRLDGEQPRAAVPDPVEPPAMTGVLDAASPARLGLEQLFPGFEAHLQAVSAPGPVAHLERAKELWLMGQETAAKRELYAAAHHPRAGKTERWIAASLRHAMGSLYFGMRYGLHYLRALNRNDEAPPERIALAYPMPYRDAIVRHALARGIEPALVAAIVREESVFDAEAGSRAGARGLMQLMPDTGRVVSRWLGIRGYRSWYLKRPDFNLRLGTEYLRVMLETNSGSIARALAAYNAGPAVVSNWLDEMGEVDDDVFVEEIPYRETRNYVRAVIRDFAGYLAAYGSFLPGDAAGVPDVEAASAAGEAAARAADL